MRPRISENVGIPIYIPVLARTPSAYVSAEAKPTVTKTIENTIFRKLFIVGLLLFISKTISHPVSAQSVFLPSSSLYRIELQEQSLKGEAQYFLGNQPSYFETENLLSPSNGYFKRYGLRDEYMVEASLFWTSFYEQRVRLPRIGTNRYPVYRSSFLTGSSGLPLSHGDQVWLSLDSRFKPLESLYFSLQMNSGAMAESTSESWFHLEQAYFDWKVRSLIFSFGRKSLHWGQSFIAPLLISGNATALNLFEVSTLPVRLPFFLRHIGLFKTDLFVSRLGEEREPGNEWLAGWRIGWKPLSSLEFNGAMVYLLAGDGVDDSASEIFIEILGARDSDASGAVSVATDRMFMFDFRWTLPLKNVALALYGENHLEDDCFQSLSCVERAISYTYGLDYVQELVGHYRIEYSRTSRVAYAAGKWRSSFTVDGRLAGSPLGRDSQGVYFMWEKDFLFNLEPKIQIFWEEFFATNRDRDRTVESLVPGYRNSEKRLGVNLNVRRSNLWQSRFGVEGALGLIRVVNKDRTNARNTWEWLSSLGLTYRFN